MRAEIISVGEEVLRGDVVNTNGAFLAARLSELGFSIRHQSTVGDVERDLLKAIKTAISRSHITVFIGGLGPTDDDMTKETVAKAIGRNLYLHSETAESMRAWFASRNVNMTENNLKQAMVIEGGEVLKNENGTAPGIYIQQGNQAIILLPGPPRELEPLFYQQVRPRLERFTDSCNHYVTLHIFGIGESALEVAIKDLLYKDNPTAACYAKTGEVEVRITARGRTAEEAERLANRHADEIKRRVGSFVYSDKENSLAETVVEKLRIYKKHIALAESCTGGLMAAELTAISGASEVFEFGISSYADWVKKRDLDVDRMIISKYTAISSETAAEMAKGAFHEGRADIGVGITGQAGPTRGNHPDKEIGLVYIAVADNDRVIVKEFHFGDRRDRQYIRTLAVKNALDMVRRIVDKLPIEDAYSFKHKEVADIARVQKRNQPNGNTGKTLLMLIAILASAATILLSVNSGTERKASPGFKDRVKVDYLMTGEEPTRVKSLSETARINSDTVGWLSVTDTDLGGAVMHTRDNDFYTSHDFEKNASPAGCMFVDSSIDFSRNGLSNIIIYGSGSGEEQMGFANKYTETEFIISHPLLSFERLMFGTRDYRVVSVYYADSSDDSEEFPEYNRYFSFEDYDEFSVFIINAKLRSIYNTPVDVYFGDRFITLVSDIRDWEGAKLVIVARQVRPDEKQITTLDNIERNTGVVHPGRWYEINGASPTVDRAAEYEKWAEWLRLTDIYAPEPEPEAELEEDTDYSSPVNVDSEQANDAIGTPVDTGEGTGMSGPGGGPSDPPVTQPADPPVSGGNITVTSASTGKKISGTPLEIISMIVEAEVGSSFHPEAIKAQAVATITYLKYSYRTSSAPTVALQNASSTVKNCVAEVIDVAMLYNGNFIYSPYCSSMAMRSNACDEVWVQSLPYLVSVESKYDSQASGYNRTYTWTKSEMKKILENWYEISLSEDADNWLQILGYTSGGYVGNMSIDGQYATTGSRFRANCVGIRSAAFTLTYDPESEVFTIVTSGYGHGVGMSQHGANFYAVNEGWDYKRILSHYYTGISFGSAAW